jgi:hypothetical protein
VPAVVVSEQRKVDVPAEPVPENTVRASEDRTRAAGRMEIVLSGCPFRKLYSRIAMVQSAEERLGHDGTVTLDRPVFG